MRIALVAVWAAILTAGCASQDGGGLGFAREGATPDPYYKEYHELLAGEHHKVFELPVEGGARLLDVGATLEARTNGLPIPDAAPARLRIALLSPAGAELAIAELDPQTTTRNLTVVTPEPGVYLLRVDGFGASQPVEGEAYGASYALVAEVLY